MSTCNIDIETFSPTSIRRGVYRYAEDPRTEILVICWKLDDGPVQAWASWADDYDDLDDFCTILADPGIRLQAYNAQFERVMLNSAAGTALGLPRTPISRWDCTAVRSAIHALPRDLGSCAAALGTHPKDEEGKKAMLALSKPRTAGKAKGQQWPVDLKWDEYQLLVEYCRDDVLAEVGVAERLPAPTRAEREAYIIDQEINDRGIRVDTKLASWITGAWFKRKRDLANECEDLCGVRPSQVQLLRGEIEHLGVKAPDLTAVTIRDILAKENLPAKARRLLEIRQEYARTSVTKFDTLLEAVNKDGRLRGMFLFDGAQTGRWTGRIVQLHNLPRNTSDNPEEVIEALYDGTLELTGDIAQQLIRPTFTGKPHLLVGDYASIELRVALWFANDKKALKKIRKGVDMYVDLATKIYKKPHAEISKPERFVGKQAVLGLGYGMGPPKFVDYCHMQGQPIAKELAVETVGIYRTVYKSIYDAWWELEAAAVKAIKHPGQKIACLDGKIHYVKRGVFLYCILPSGRPITYPYAKMGERPAPWDKKTMLPTITFMGVDQYTRKWSEQTTFGGKLFENICQGTASCLLRFSLARLYVEGFDIVGHVHDEVICEGKKKQLARFEELMSETPDWAEGIPMEIEAQYTRRYTK